MARSLEEIIQQQEPQVASAAKRKAAEVLEAIADKTAWKTVEEKPTHSSPQK